MIILERLFTSRHRVPIMRRVISILLVSFATWFRSRLSIQMELIALRHQVAVYQQSSSRPKLRPTDRLLWVWLSRLWPGWQEAAGPRW